VSASATVTPVPEVLQQPSVQLPPVVVPVDFGDQQQEVAIPVQAQGQPPLDQGGYRLQTGKYNRIICSK